MKTKKLTKKQIEINERREGFSKDFKKLSTKYKLDIGTVLKYTQSGIFPILTFLEKGDEKNNNK